MLECIMAVSYCPFRYVMTGMLGKDFSVYIKVCYESFLMYIWLCFDYGFKLYVRVCDDTISHWLLGYVMMVCKVYVTLCDYGFKLYVRVWLNSSNWMLGYVKTGFLIVHWVMLGQNFSTYIGDVVKVFLVHQDMLHQGFSLDKMACMDYSVHVQSSFQNL